MLIYNHQKEFVGIDEQDLNTLGFENLEELRSQSNEFADLFVKKPGYVHNFKHVNWIDFVACADSIESTKVIIKAKGKSFRSLLEIKTVYLLEDPSSKSFLIYLTNIRELIDDENNDNFEQFAETPLQAMPIPTTVPISTPPKKEITETIFDNQADMPNEVEMPIEELLLSSIDLDNSTQLHHDSEFGKNSLEEDLKIDLEMDDDFTAPEQITIEATMEVFDNGYIFDPHVASEELGLPVDLIEEFIEDFIAQAKEFQEDLYTALENGDNDNLKILSHKLKGVAANLRIEDALESLTIINTSSSATEIKNHLDILYKIISKLAGEKVQVSKNTAVDTFSPVEEIIEDFEDFDQETKDLELLDLAEAPETVTEEEEDTDLDLNIFEIQEPQPKIKEDEPAVKTNIPELADDDFLKELDPITLSDFEVEEITEAEEEIKEADDDFLKPEEETKVINYDTEYIAREIGLSQESFMELFEDYLEEANDLSNAISDAIEENTAQKWKSKALQLKGMSDNMRVKDLIKDLQTLIDTQDSSIAQEANTEIKKSLIEISKLKG